MALIDKLRAIGDAIRLKRGITDGLTLDEMPTQIGMIGGVDKFVSPSGWSDGYYGTTGNISNPTASAEKTSAVFDIIPGENIAIFARVNRNFSAVSDYWIACGLFSEDGTFISRQASNVQASGVYFVNGWSYIVACLAVPQGAAKCGISLRTYGVDFECKAIQFSNAF